MNKKLIVIEGFDRSGKDTLMNDIYNSFKNENTYIYFNDLTGMPKYDKDKENYLDWLNKFIKKQVEDLNNIFKKYDIVIMCRLLISDEVYSILFNREHTTIKYMDELNNIDVYNYCILFKNYDEYINRLNKINDNNIQYTKEEFDKINSLYIDILNNLDNSYINDIYAYTTKRNILENFIQYYDKTITK